MGWIGTGATGSVIVRETRLEKLTFGLGPRYPNPKDSFPCLGHLAAVRVKLKSYATFHDHFVLGGGAGSARAESDPVPRKVELNAGELSLSTPKAQPTQL